MITQQQVFDLAKDYLGEHDFTVSRDNGGWLIPCGYSVSIIDDIPGDTHTVFIHEDNDYNSLVSKMIRFSEQALNPTF